MPLCVLGHLFKNSEKNTSSQNKVNDFKVGKRAVCDVLTCKEVIIKPFFGIASSPMPRWV